ncbi:hypothetical protein GSI_14577 [Ganoderma sinense ZZ0214-1]|uniref:XPG-I domain-containing protein n=1 Tax=Ganoderma sinense ZZ0214-1 TaxID=1077348 RepID=A0A2G8RP40_9APHY|nr:hypothetical protein GSI_14577 [Ganoderma sinense ZZ0214-1]
MHRVRLLRHHGIAPYLVLDGGPLPAKKGTEASRAQRRAEALARGDALAAQGRHAQAREHYVKCVDVTPQMAYQLIKALRAEGVPYVVAPYEADAQLAYLERIGLVDGIITEDSDLLVFGCRNVLFKLDTAAATVTHIARVDFAAVALPAGPLASSTASAGLSLAGWSDTQFRTMAILSGCDYLPSIPGIGLKTAWVLLRKHRTVEGMLGALRREGKKRVPKGYLDAFRRAEQVFLHQRVYDPASGRLVHLTEVPPVDADVDADGWDAEKEAYVGANIEPSLAKAVAEGDTCPITLLPMEDINPGYVPRALKPIPMNRQGHGASASTSTSSTCVAVARPDKGKGRAKEGPSEKPGLLKFFAPQAREAPSGRDGGAGARSVSGPAPKPGPRPGLEPPLRESGSSGSAATATTARPAMAVGKRSGKRTLAGVMDDEIAAKRKKQEDAAAAASAGAGAGAATPRVPTTSKFFHAVPRSVSDPRGDRLALGWGRPVATPEHARRGHGHGHSQEEPVAGSSGLSQREKEKENVHPEADGVGDADMDADADADQDQDLGGPDAITQEDGYASPTESMGQWDSPDISSPVRPGAARRGGGWDEDEEEDYDADVLSSSPVARTRTDMRKRPAVVVERLITRALPLRPVLNTSFSQRKRARSRSRSRSRSGSRTRRRKLFGGRDEELDDGIGVGEGSWREGSVAGRDGPDLRKAMFDEFDDDDDIHDWDDITSGGEDYEDGLDGDTLVFADEDVMFSTASSTPGAVTPATDGDDIDCEGETAAVLLDEGSSEELEGHSPSGAASAQNAKVAHGWWEKWARSGASARGQGANSNSNSRPNVAGGAGSDQRPLLSIAATARTPGSGLRRRETTMTPDGRQRPLHRMAGEGPHSAPQVSKRKVLQHQDDLRVTRRRSLAFTTAEPVRTTPKPAGGARMLAPTSRARAGAGAGNSDNPGASTSTVTGEAGLTVSTRNRLEQFRWTPACR